MKEIYEHERELLEQLKDQVMDLTPAMRAEFLAWLVKQPLMRSNRVVFNHKQAEEVTT